MKVTIAFANDELDRQVKIRAAASGRPIRGIFEEALGLWLQAAEDQGGRSRFGCGARRIHDGRLRSASSAVCVGRFSWPFAASSSPSAASRRREARASYQAPRTCLENPPVTRLSVRR
jgi:hypothetical protein